MKFNQDTINQIHDRAAIEEVVGDFVSLKRKGQNMWACCPFHDEKTPSFSVAPNKGIYKCFGCGKSGDSIQFIMDIEALTFGEAIKYLADKYGIEVEEEEQTDEQIREQNEKESLFIVLNYASEFFKNKLWNDQEGRSVGLSYFKERGFNDAIIEKFGLGYSMNTWDALIKGAESKGYNLDILDKAGLIVRKEDRQYDRFRHRVMFPVHNISGKVIAFGGRILVNDKKQPKYINSPETEVYHKSRVLYGIYQAKQAIRQADNCYLVEGYTDVISMHLAGVENVVASSGTSLTEEQIRLVSRYTKNITVLFDGDAAGIKASLRGIDMILQGGMNVKAVVFPDGEDPDSYAQKIGSSAFQKYLEENAQDFITFKTNLFIREANGDPMRKAETIKEIVSSISRVPDFIQRAVYLKQCSELLDIEEAILVGEVNAQMQRRDYEEQKRAAFQQRRQLQQQQQQIPQQYEEPPADLFAPDAIIPAQKSEEKAGDRLLKQGIGLSEREVIRLLIVYGPEAVDENSFWYEYMINETLDVEFQTPIYREIMNLFKEQLEAGNVINFEYLKRNSEGEIREEVINMIAERYEISQSWTERFQIYVPKETEILNEVVFRALLRLKIKVVQQLIDENRQAMLKAGENPEAEQEHLMIHMELKKTEMEIASLLGNVVVK